MQSEGLGLRQAPLFHRGQDGVATLDELAFAGFYGPALAGFEVLDELGYRRSNDLGYSMREKGVFRLLGGRCGR